MSASAIDKGHPASDLRLVWEPLEIGATRVKNRIMMTAQTTLYGKDNILGDRHIAYYRERAKGGAALFICEQQAAHRLSKGSFFEGCSAWDKRAIPQYARLADAVHEHGARQFIQLFGCGVHDKGTMIMDEWHPLWGVSSLPSVVHNDIPLIMEQQHIDDLVTGFGESALNVKVAGCDGVELHAAHSYLLGQFLSPVYNDRTDRYGGSVRNRCRILIEIGEAIRERAGDALTVGVRLSFDEFLGDAGITPDQAEEQLEILSSSGLFDFFNISGGAYHTLHFGVAPMSVKQGFMIPFGKRAKAVVGNRAKVFFVGRIIDLRQAEQALADGAADMVAMTRAQMAEPHLVKKTLEGREREIRRCMGANECVARLFDNRQAACVVNPTVGREARWGSGTLRPVAPDEAKTLVVVGGGLAGMKTAEVAGRRGHRVVLPEREDRLGGHLNLLLGLPTRNDAQGVGHRHRQSGARHGGRGRRCEARRRGHPRIDRAKETRRGDRGHRRTLGQRWPQPVPPGPPAPRGNGAGERHRHRDGHGARARRSRRAWPTGRDSGRNGLLTCPWGSPSSWRRAAVSRSRS